MTESSERSAKAALIEEFESYSGVDRWFRMELAVGLGAAYEQKLSFRAQDGEISDQEYSEVFIEGAEWAIDRGRARFGDHPSKIAELEGAIWKIFGSEERVGAIFERFRAGAFHYYTGDSHLAMGIYLVGDDTMFVFKKPEEETRQAA